MAFGSDGRRLATAGDNHTVRVWDVGSGRQLAILTHDSALAGVAFSPNGRWLATACRRKATLIWALDVESDEETGSDGRG